MSSRMAGLQPFWEGWGNHQQLLLAAVEGLTIEQLGLRAAPESWAVWQLASHIAGARAYWMHDVLGEGDPATRDMFRMERTTVPGVRLEDAGWEDEEDHPRDAGEIAEALAKTWAVIDDCLRRWTPEDLVVEFSRPGGGRRSPRGWVLWHLVEHDTHHGGAISLILGSHGLPGLDI